MSVHGAEPPPPPPSRRKAGLHKANVSRTSAHRGSRCPLPKGQSELTITISKSLHARHAMGTLSMVDGASPGRHSAQPACPLEASGAFRRDSALLPHHHTAAPDQRQVLQAIVQQCQASVWVVP